MQSAAMDVSPMQPPRSPKRKCMITLPVSPNSLRSASIPPLLIRVSGVADATASVLIKDFTGAVYWLSSKGNTAMHSARAASAGLKMFLPRPPKIPLITTTATSDPTAHTNQGVAGGRLKANSSPARKADPSAMRGRRFNARSNEVSNTTQNPMHQAVVMIAFRPKTNHAAMNAGARAALVSYMICWVKALA